MKKTIFVVMAILAIFAIVSCDNGTTEKKVQVTVTFKLSEDATEAYATKTVEKGSSIGTGAFPSNPDAEEGFVFLGWATSATATQPNFTATTKVNQNMTVYAIFEEEGGPIGGLYELPADAIALGDFTIENSDKQKGWFTDGVDDKDSTLDIADVVGAEYLVLDLSAAPSGGVQFIWQGDSDNWNWNQITILENDGSAIDGITTITTEGETTVLKIALSTAAGTEAGGKGGYDNFLANTQVKFYIAYYSPDIDGLGILRAYLLPLPPPPPPPPVAAPDRAVAKEVVTLGNAWQVVYKFDLPTGKAWEDYQTIDVTYVITDPAMFTNENGARSIRLYGNYNVEDFELLTTNDGSKLAVANFSKLGNGDYILADAGGGWKTIETYFSEKGITAGVNDFFTISYKLDGSTKNSAYNEAHLPADDAPGPFYFGLGIAGQGIPTTTIITKVEMVGYDDADNFLATPAYFKSSDSTDTYEYPAFVGYGNKDGSAGEDDAKRTVIKAYLVSVDKEPYAETVTLENAWQAMYKFSLPEDKTWEDYETIQVTYAINDEAMLHAENSARAIRLYGNYKESDFEFLVTDAGNALAIANFSKGNGEYILADAGGGWFNLARWLVEKSGLSITGDPVYAKDDEGNDTDAVIDYENLSYTLGDEFTVTYKLDGSMKNGSYKDANKPAEDATGPFFFALGIAGQGTGTTVDIIKVEMVGYDSNDTFTAAPAYFKDILDPDSDEYAGYVGYGNKDGSAGEDGASRVPIEP